MSGSVSLCSPSPSIPSRAGGPPGRRWVGGMGGGSKWRGPAQPSSAHHSPRHPTRPHLTPYTRVVILPPLVTLVRWMEWDERCDERMMTTRAGSHVSLRLVSAIWCLNRLVPSHLRPLSTSLLVHRPPLVTLRLTSSTSLVSSGGRREDTTDGRRRETSGERKWHAWAKGRRKWVKGGHFLGPVPPAGTAKGRDGTEEWRPVPHSSHYEPPGAGEWTEWAVPTEEARRATGPRFTRGTRKRAGPCPCRPEACTEGPKHSEGSEVRRPVPSLRPTSETVRRWREGCRGVGWGRERA